MAVSFDDLVPQAPVNFDDLVPQTAPAPQGGVMGALKGASRALEANLPFVDRAVAAAKGGDYAANLATERAKNEQFAAQNPWTNAVGGIVSSAPLATFGGPTFGLGGLGGRVASAAVPWAAAGGIEGASSSPDLTDLSQGGVAKNALIGAASSGALGAAVPLVGAAVGKAISPLAGALHNWRNAPGPADVAKLGGDVKAAYQSMRDLGAGYSPQQYQALVDKITSDAQTQRINAGLEPGASSAIEDMQKAATSGKPVDLDLLDQDRQIAWDKTGSRPDPRERMFGGMIRRNIDDFIKNAEPQAMEARPATPTPNYNPPIGPDPNYVPPGEPAKPAASQETAAAPPRPSGPAPIPLLDVMRNYGLQDEGGDLASMGFANKAGVAGKGAFKVIDKENGVPMDEGLRIAQEQGYMEPHETVADFINKLGDHPTYARADAEEVARRAERNEFDLGMVPEREPLTLGEAPPQPKLVVAAEMGDGSIKYGKPGQIHGDLYPEYGWELPKKEDLVKHFGFAEPGGPFMTRQEAADFMGASKPLMSDDIKPSSATAPVAPTQVPPAPSSSDAYGAIQTAHDLAMRQFKAQALAKALSKAEINAHVSGTGGNIENATRQSLARAREKEPWSQDELDQIDKMLHGGVLTNTLRQFSRLGPKGNALMAAIELAHGGPGAIGAAVGGTAAQIGEGFARRAGQGRLLATILAGGKAPVAPPVGPGPTRAALAAALASRQLLPPQRNTQQQ